ncbi:hypothetical protein V1503_18725 [Bacillus sp. SCS-151]|uniref:hypothetical protein n=1 Tax=Nanhaiella sioensis TaxID=3115293 RepID=UPI00397E8120
MSNCGCKGKGNSELLCKCDNTPITFASVNVGADPTTFISLTTDKLLVTEKDWIAKIDSMVVIQADVADGTSLPLILFYEIERITGNTTKSLCRYAVNDNRDGQYTLTPNNTVCDEPGLGCHQYRLSVTGLIQQGVSLTFNCRCINVTTFQKR